MPDLFELLCDTDWPPLEQPPRQTPLLAYLLLQGKPRQVQCAPQQARLLSDLIQLFHLECSLEPIKLDGLLLRLEDSTELWDSSKGKGHPLIEGWSLQGPELQIEEYPWKLLFDKFQLQQERHQLKARNRALQLQTQGLLGELGAMQQDLRWRLGRILAFLPRKIHQRARRLALRSEFWQRILGLKEDYHRWYVEHYYLDEKERQGLLESSDRPNAPIDVLIPMEALNEETWPPFWRSLQEQLHGKWELHLIGKASPAEYFELPASPKIHRHPDLLTALSQKAVPHLLYLEQAAQLSEDALYRFAHALEEYPRTRLCYADHDRIDSEGIHFEHHFKPDWNPDLLRSKNYLGPALLVERQALLEVARELTPEHRKTWAFALALANRCTDPEIHHIPRPLLHFLQKPARIEVQSGSEILLATLPPDLNEAQIEYQEETHCYRLRPNLNRLPKVSVLILTRDKKELLQTCLDSLWRSPEEMDYEILILDNGSKERVTLDYLKELEESNKARVIRDEGEFNFAKLNNRLAREATGELLCLMNNDIEIIEPGWMREMASHALRPEIGAVGAMLLYPNGLVQHAGVILGINQSAGHGHKFLRSRDGGYQGRLQATQNYSALTAACLMVRKEVYDEVEGMEEAFQVAYNDVDFCLKLVQAGYRNLYTPYARLIHHESLSRGLDRSPKDRARLLGELALLQERWPGPISGDPAYNPNLTRSEEDFSLKR